MERFPDALRARFEPHRVLGQGSSGVVYHCTDARRGGPVALKLLALRDVDEPQRLEQEARVVQTLRHPNIARLHEWGKLPDAYWMSMEYLEGETLRSLLARAGPFQSGRQVLLLTRQAVKALQHAHRRGVLHRDVKPENLFLGKDQVLKLLDFGLAKWERDARNSVRTRPGMVLGTPAYIAPERCRGEAASPASDVYSLAAVVYEMMAGQPPFRGAPLDVIQAQLREPPPPLPPSIPGELAAAVLAGLGKEPGARPATPTAFMDGLRAAARRVIDKQRRGETPKEQEAVSDFQADDLASHGEYDQPEARPAPPRLPPAAPGPSLDAADEPPPTTRMDAVPGPTKAMVEASASGVGGALEPDELVSSRPTRSLRREPPTSGGPLGRQVRRLSRALVPPGLLSPRVRPFLLGGVGLVLILVAWRLIPTARPASLPERIEVIPGIEGAEVQWRAARAGRWGFLILPAGEAPPPRWLPDTAQPAPRDRGREVRPGLVPDTAYVLFVSGEDGLPQRVQEFRTAASFRVRELSFLEGSGGRLRLRIEALQPWVGTFGAEDPEGELRESHVLLLPSSPSRLPELRVRTAGAAVARVADDLPRAVLDTFEELLVAMDADKLGRELFSGFPQEVLESSGVGAPETLVAARAWVGRHPELAAVLQVRRYFGAVLDAENLPADRRFAFARRLAELACLDGALEALGAQEVLGEGGELVGALRRYFMESTPSLRIPAPDQGEPRGAVWHWWDLSENDLHHRGMSEDQVAEYHTSRLVFFSQEKPYRAEMVAQVTVPEGEGRVGELGLVVRAAPPETVLMVEVNGRVVVPVRWSAEHGAIRWESERNPARDLAPIDPRMLDVLPGLVTRLAPNMLRRFRLPKGILVSGDNQVRLWSLNTRPRPSGFLLSVVQGVYLRVG